MKKKNFCAGVLLTSVICILGSTGAVYAADNASSTVYTEYAEILSRYYDGVSSYWSTSDFQANGLNYLFGYDPNVNTLGYYLKDIDNNGTEELFIGRTDDEGIYMGMIYDMYTMVDGELTQVLTSGERDCFYLCEDNEIAELGSGGALSTSHCYYNYENGKLEKTEEVFMDGFYDEQNPWFYSTGEDVHEISITEEEGQAVIDSHKYVTNPYKPVSGLF